MGAKFGGWGMNLAKAANNTSPHITKNFVEENLSVIFKPFYSILYFIKRHWRKPRYNAILNSETKFTKLF